MADEVLERILRRVKELGLSPRSASMASGLTESAIRDMIRRPGMSRTMETINKLAVGLKTTPEWLAYGVGPGEEAPAGMAVEHVATTGDIRDVKTAFVPATYAGVVEAGAFRQVDEFNDDPGVDPIVVTSDRDFPFAKMVFFDVAGDSMNALKPRPILSGDRLICINYEASISRLPFRDGMVVVVEQTTGGGHLRERSIKQLEVYDDRHEFHPRSTNPKHKPIVVEKDKDADDGRQVRIIAIVRSIMNEVPLS